MLSLVKVTLTMLLSTTTGSALRSIVVILVDSSYLTVVPFA